MSEQRKPNPGSDEALCLGCSCPVLDNGHGAGCGRKDEHGEPQFWIREDCPIHGATPPPTGADGEGGRGE
jgi:hypothetical protein